ncbi:30S ribosome-binding factor RbfA [Buchnera aphidicola (Kurisakia onigurumii)]|uniref:30S ribosome-binding factor RbfA n=1 Tax=Buchnera aphidicola TaxID=9 RepID=UPI0031B69B05
MQGNRSFRVSNELKKEISCILKQSIRDPRLDCLITISEIDVSKDLSYAKVFVTFIQDNINEYEDKKKIKEILKILKNASGYIRFLISKRLNMRIIPFLSFYYDDSFFKGYKISKIIDNAINE